MAAGPITIFDKSALQGLNVDEACLFGNFYRINITPVFFVETLADLEKEVAAGRTPEQVVGTIAHKTSGMYCDPNVHHQLMCFSDLGREPIDMRGVPVVSGGRPVESGGKRGIVFSQAPEVEALQRWRRSEFLAVERKTARRWREVLTQLDLQTLYERFRPLMKGANAPRDFGEIRTVVDSVLGNPTAGESLLHSAFGMLAIPYEFWGAIFERWKAAGKPPLTIFAPYAAHVVSVDLFFALGLAADLISRERPSNKADMAYLYYLPFCMVFTSSDNLHARIVPYFLGRNQVFVPGADLKADLRRLDDYYSAFPDDVKATGLMTFARHPPLESDFMTSKLWDRFLPRWRENAGKRVEMSKEVETELLQKLKEMNEGATAETEVSLDEAAFVSMQQKVPTQMGKYRIVPPGAENKSGESA
jgi:hypothetical protein